MHPNEILFGPASLGEPSSRVSLRWLGTAGFELCADDHVILFDPYLTRASLAQCLWAPLRSNEAILAKHLPRADAIVLGHTHFDHALDTPSIAKRTGARVLGSRSASHLCRAAGVPEAQVDDVESASRGSPIVREIGPFRLTFHPSAHAPLVLGRVPFEGEITDCDHVPERANDYLCGAVFGVEVEIHGKTLFHVGSAEVLERMPRIEVDVALVCAAGWTSSPGFPERLAAKISPRKVVLSHWDNFLAPLTRTVSPLPLLQTGRLVERLERASRDLAVGTLPLLGRVNL